MFPASTPSKWPWSELVLSHSKWETAGVASDLMSRASAACTPENPRVCSDEQTPGEGAEGQRAQKP